MQTYQHKEWTRDHANVLYGPLAAFMDTIWKDKSMCGVVLLLWGCLALLIAGVVAFDEPNGPMVISGATMSFFAYLLYILQVAAPASGCFDREEKKIDVDEARCALEATAHADYSPVREHLSVLQEAAPILTLHVECYRERHKTNGKTQKFIKYSSSWQLPVRKWKDISPPPVQVSDSLERYGANFAAVRYRVSYELCPEQQPVLEILRQAYEDHHRHRDDHIRTWFSYTCTAHDEERVERVAKPTSYRYLLSRLWVNYFVFYFCLVLPLYPLYIIGWKLFQKPYFLENHKLLYLDHVKLTDAEPVSV